MSYTPQEAANLRLVENTLIESSHDFTQFFEQLFAPDCKWTIAGHGPVARTYTDMKDLFKNAEEPLFARFAQPLVIETKGIWADGDNVFARVQSASRAIDGLPYKNEYMFILTINNGKVVSGIEWLDLNAYYDIIERIAL